MLGGLAPVLIFYFNEFFTATGDDALAGIPQLFGQGAQSLDLPIPIYLSESLTGIIVDNESKALDLDTIIEAKSDDTKPDIKQRAINSDVSIELIAQKSSIILSALLALNDIVLTKVITQNYSISYLNGPTTIFNGLLKTLTTNPGQNDDLIRVSLTISKANQKTTKPQQLVEAIQKATGTTPIAGSPPS